jgi:hypothetical protein
MTSIFKRFFATPAKAACACAIPVETTDSILADLSKGIARLDKLAEKKAKKSDLLSEQAAELVTRANEAAAESARAERVADRLAQLLA